MLTVSDTAYSIARVRAMEGDRPPAERLFEDPFAMIFDAAGAHAWEGTERFLSLPFFVDGIRLRTRFIDDAVRDALAAGLSQVVLLGAGFDARGLRMPEIRARGARVYEVDLAALLETKRALLDAAGVTPPPWLSYVACDFTAPDFERALTDDLAARGFQPGTGAVFVWEGVAAYLDRASIDRSLAFMARAGGPGSRAIFDYGHGFFDPETALERVRRLGFSACDEVAYDALWRRYLPGDAHENAWVCLAGVATV